MEKREYTDISLQNKEKRHKVRKSKVERKEIEYLFDRLFLLRIYH